MKANDTGPRGKNDRLLDVSGDFGDFDGRLWLNCAHQGPLPHVAAEAAMQAVAMKQSPHRLAESAPFDQAPTNLRETLAALIDVPPDDIILGNSASYGLSVLANGLPWKPGDEILLVRGDFPATSFAWLHLADRGVKIRFLETRGSVLDAAELRASLSRRTRLVCTTWVHSLTGGAIDVRACSEVCRKQGVLFILNATQGLGAQPLAALSSGVDALTASGFKWLLGPYGTGFSWVRPSLRERLRRTKSYWLVNLSTEDLSGEFPIRLRPDTGARQFDVFCPAAFFNCLSWTAAVNRLLDIGIERIEAHNGVLVDQFLETVDGRRYEIMSPRSGAARTAIIVLRTRSSRTEAEVFEALRRQGIDISLRQGLLRISPHLYNTGEQITRLVSALNSQ